MDNFIVVEVGSTVTKAYQYLEGNIITHPAKTITFKANFQNGKLKSSDVKTLIDYVCGLKKITSKVFVYGTSIFRSLDEKEQANFLKSFKEKTGLIFNVVSAEQEALYTVSGVILDNDYTGRLAIVICGGGSTEIVVVENKKIIEKHFNNFGAISVNEKFKNINEFKTKVNLNKVYKFCEDNLEDVVNKCDVVVTAGGDTRYCQECMASAYLTKNALYYDAHQPHMIKVCDFEKANKAFILKQDINVYKNFTVYRDDWWNCARSYNSCLLAAARKVGAKYEIPTRINMCVGIINELKNK